MDAEEECPQCGRLERIHEGGTLFCAHCGFALGSAAFDDEVEREYGQTGTIIRKKEDKVKQKSSKIYRGSKGYKLFLQAWQHILWRQCHAAIHVGGLPPELWNVVKDLWALRLSKLRYRFEEPVASNVEKEEGNDPMHSSGAECETDSNDNDEQLERMASAKVSSPKSLDSVALLYLGTLLLRLPLTIQTLHDWIIADTVPFIRPIRYIPSEISRHLASEYVGALETKGMPTAQQLQQAVFWTATVYSEAFRMSLPPLNMSPLLHTMVESLALPLEVYRLAKQLNSIVGFTFDYLSASMSRRQPTTTYPEAQLMSLIVIAAKLLFPFDADHTQRFPSSLSQPGALLLDWPKWTELKDRFQKSITEAKERRAQPGVHLLTQDVGVMSMTDEQLDQYMDWYQDTFTRVQNRDDSTLDEQLLDMFPVPDRLTAPLAVKIETHKQYQVERQALRMQRLEGVLNEALSTQKPVSQEEAERRVADVGEIVLRPGTKYQSVKHIKDLDGPAEAFYQEAAELSSLTLDQLVRAVRHTELKIERWRHEQRRREMWSDDMDSEPHESIERATEDS
ncbi:hypothetical protein DV736_g4475, partial [Chaetothyriales sp. CBS 134916]